MAAIDGIYSYAGTFTRWDARGVEIHRGGRSSRLRWRDLVQVRATPPPVTHVVLEVRDRYSPRVAAADEFAIPVRSEADANRLLMLMGWQSRGGFQVLPDPAGDGSTQGRRRSS